MHTLISGMTESGKTYFAKILCERLNKEGHKTAVLDPLRDDGWKCDEQTNSPADFLKWAKENREGFLFVDEGSISVGRNNVEMEWLATMSRHFGHSTFFICQALTQLGPTLRGQCTRLYLFTSAAGVSKIAAEEFNQPDLLKSDRLQKGEFIEVNRFGALRHFALDFSKRRIMLRG